MNWSAGTKSKSRGAQCCPLILGLDVHEARDGKINSVSAYFWECALQAI